ncbi:unnamed protein product [Adineta steineri]|uniref:Uncharacterized protein n=1 Tax=Adineta steineri TaxID=433720 RepID=A0A816D0B0_9BILA|nr:unnamed protein product [Adineta steineri]CAF1628424.1 unnamed protein product [Adineta steineri]
MDISSDISNTVEELINNNSNETSIGAPANTLQETASSINEDSQNIATKAYEFKNLTIRASSDAYKTVAHPCQLICRQSRLIDRNMEGLRIKVKNVKVTWFDGM